MKKTAIVRTKRKTQIRCAEAKSRTTTVASACGSVPKRAATRSCAARSGSLPIAVFAVRHAISPSSSESRPDCCSAYFPTKDALIDRIYETLFAGRWKPEWDDILGNRSRGLLDRLTEFYRDYATMLHDYEWGRIYLYSGLEGAGIAQRFARLATDRAYARVVGELRHEYGRPDLATLPMSEPEIELMWSLHGSIFYIGMRKWVYNVGGPSDVPGTVTQIVERFHVNARDLMLQLAEQDREEREHKREKPPIKRRRYSMKASS